MLSDILDSLSGNVELFVMLAVVFAAALLLPCKSTRRSLIAAGALAAVCAVSAGLYVWLRSFTYMSIAPFFAFAAAFSVLLGRLVRLAFEAARKSSAAKGVAVIVLCAAIAAGGIFALKRYHAENRELSFAESRPWADRFSPHTAAFSTLPGDGTVAENLLALYKDGGADIADMLYDCRAVSDVRETDAGLCVEYELESEDARMAVTYDGDDLKTIVYLPASGGSVTFEPSKWGIFRISSKPKA